MFEQQIQWGTFKAKRKKKAVCVALQFNYNLSNCISRLQFVRIKRKRRRKKEGNGARAEDCSMPLAARAGNEDAERTVALPNAGIMRRACLMRRTGFPYRFGYYIIT